MFRQDASNQKLKQDKRDGIEKTEKPEVHMTIHISSIYQNTFATDIKVESNAESTPIHPTSEIKYILPEDSLQDNIIFIETPTIDGKYQKIKKTIKFSELNTIKNLKHSTNISYVQHCRSDSDYLFVFKVGDFPIFVKKSNEEILRIIKMDECIIQKNTEIMII